MSAYTRGMSHSASSTSIGVARFALKSRKAMATANIVFSVTASDGLKYWLAVDDQDLQVVNGRAAARLERGAEHVLVWWMIGDPGDSLSIEGKDGQRTVVTVKESRIPADTDKLAGYRRFMVP